MSIKALPADACRLLGSTTVIANPVSLVKELVENAIDADATAIDVLVSPNTVDKIEVRDNGHGINIVDFDALGRRGHTSKIRRLEDLKTVSGPSLGFRGEGLASIITLGYVAITTRTSDEAIALTFRLVPGLGGISPEGRKPVPAPIGTTVSVSCLFSTLPVRRKVAVQNASKTMTAIKTLLCGYAMARPHLRLSFKALKEAVPPWSYRPMTNNLMPDGNTGIRLAVVMLFGAEVARQCQDIVTSIDNLLDGQSTLSQSLSNNTKEETDSVIFEACLPRTDADLTKLKLGGFVSVDGRPLSIHHNGVVDKLLTVFHTSFGRLLSQLGSPQQPRVRGTFMRLNIKCPAGSYDANVDSSKTDVLFADEKFLCDAFARLCAKTYAATEQMRYQNGDGKYPPSTPVRTQPTLAFGGSAYGGSDVAQSQTRPLQQRLSHDTDSSPAQGYIQSPFASSPSGVVTRRETRHGHGEGQSPISQRNSMFTDALVEAPRASCNIRPVGGPIEYNFTSSRGGGVQRRTSSVFSRHIQLSPIRKRAPIRSVPVRGLQTPPSSSPAEEHQRRTPGNQDHTGLEDTELSGLVSNDGLQQTTISFGHRDRAGNQPAEADQEQPVLGESSRRSFISARGLYTQGQAEPGPSLPAEARTDIFHIGAVQHNKEAGQVTPVLQSTPPSQEMPSRRPVQTMWVDRKQLQRSAATFARNTKAWDEEPEYLSPEMADISSIKSRLRAAIVNWLAKSRAERKEAGVGSVQVEFYLRKSLKKKALLVRDLGQ